MGHVGAQSSFDLWDVVLGSSWDLVAGSFEYAPHGQYLFMTADNCGRTSLFELELRHSAKPRLLTKEGSVAGYHPFHGGNGEVKLLMSSSSMLEPSIWSILDPILNSEPVVISTKAGNGQILVLSSNQVSEIWFEGSEETCVHAWMVKPSNFDEKKRWPVILVIHGGLQDIRLPLHRRGKRDKRHGRFRFCVGEPREPG